eukprot:838046-Heterocapsa_arctica.AAC.1
MCGRHEERQKEADRELQAADDGNGAHRSTFRNGQNVCADEECAGFPHEEGQDVQKHAHLPHMQSLRRHERRPE